MSRQQPLRKHTLHFLVCFRKKNANHETVIVTELNPDALSIAAELDAERANGSTRGPLRRLSPRKSSDFLACCRAATATI